MPAQQLVYEGQDLQTLIQRVVDEHGPARIRPPVRKRKGGVLGFFAKEVYVISVDPAATERAAAGRATEDSDAVTVTGGTAGSLAALIEATEDDLTLATASAPGTLTTPGSAGSATAGTAHHEPGPPEAAPAAGTTVPSPAATPTTRAAVRPPATARSVKPFRDVLREVASSLGEEPGTYRPDPDLLRPSARALGAATGPSPNGAARPAGPVPEPAPAPAVLPAGSTALAPVTAPAVLPAGSTALAPVADPPALPLVDLLRAAGFPEHLLEPGAALPGGSTLEAFFAALPQPPALPVMAGALVAVVGDARLVRPVAQAVAAAVRCPAGEVAVAARGAGARHQAPERRVANPEEAAALAPGWRRGGTGVVAVYAPPLGADQTWTREILGALRPSCVWGTASATTKPDDVRRFMDAVGGVDALAITDTAATGSPAAVLATGIPVARLDNEMATPQRWAAVVADLVARH